MPSSPEPDPLLLIFDLDGVLTRGSRMNRALVRLGHRGLSLNKYTRLADRVGRDLALRASFPRRSAIAHARAAAAVVVVTASEEHFARGHLAGVGLGHVQICRWRDA